MKHLKSDILSVSAQYFDLYDNYAIQDKTSIKYQLWLRNSCGLELAPYTIIHYTAHMYMVGIYADSTFFKELERYAAFQFRDHLIIIIL